MIFYFDGTIGDIASNINNYGKFRVRNGAFQGLRKLSYKFQIAVLIPYPQKRSKVISCYFERFQGLPVDAIYCVRSKYLKAHGDMKFMDYRQIFQDFELVCPEKLIERCLVIAPRTKEVSAVHTQN